MVWLLEVLLLIFILRLYAILPNKKKDLLKRPSSATCTVAVFLGSGGHTSEALTLISSLDCRRYRRRIYLVSDGDVLSVQKAHDLEFKRRGSKEIQELLALPFLDNLQCTILTVPRARRVHQTLWTTPFTAARSLAFCLYHFTVLPLSRMQRTAFADVLILNGPGTCFVLCLAVFVNKLLGLPSPTVIYVETFARVKSLSLSGKLVRPFVDRFVTQWPTSESKPLTSEGWLV